MDNNLINIPQDAIVRYLHNAQGAADLPKPFEREILLLDTYIAGMNHVEELKKGTVFLEDGERVVLLREPSNRFDEYAVAVKKQDGHKVGYVPRQENRVIARLMDAGKELFGRISAVERRGELLKARVEIYLND